ncbi:sporulation protein Cse60 [Bacillus massilinigeriensis]|uniref:sporulation protein Cse60 n=1 Tax=Bacillus mediterraneensis TaxID=1805474 RepID=UPI0008F8FD34|nr:sporulation protein Cse60 [Bacillus mediterraneensis]
MIQVKVFDYEHEKDLEMEMNSFLEVLDEKKLVEIKYNVAAIKEDGEDSEGQIYCFTAMIVYRV